MQRKGTRAGLTIVELLAALVIIAILGTIVMTTLGSVWNSVKIKQATVEALDLQARIDEYAMSNDAWPATLANVGKGGALDPWGNPYIYLPFTTPENLEQARKDRWLVPLNTSYDLYSIGADGETDVSLSSAPDDIVRAADGAYVGLAAGF